MSEHTHGYCGAHHQVITLARDCPGCEEEEARFERGQECPICTRWVVEDDEGDYDCDECGAHLEPK